MINIPFFILKKMDNLEPRCFQYRIYVLPETCSTPCHIKTYLTEKRARKFAADFISKKYSIPASQATCLGVAESFEEGIELLSGWYEDIINLWIWALNIVPTTLQIDFNDEFEGRYDLYRSLTPLGVEATEFTLLQSDVSSGYQVLLVENYRNSFYIALYTESALCAVSSVEYMEKSTE